MHIGRVSYLYEIQLISKLTLQKGCLLCGGCRYPQQRKRSFCWKQTEKKNRGERLHHYWYNHSILFSFRFTWHGPVMVKPLLFVCYLVAVECLLFLFFTLVPPPYILFGRVPWGSLRPCFNWFSPWTLGPPLIGDGGPLTVPPCWPFVYICPAVAVWLKWDPRILLAR